METSNRCPLKCSENIEVREKCHKIIRNSLSELYFKCPNKEHGCPETPSYDTFLSHVSQCKFKMMRCPAFERCNTELPQQECEKHIQKCGFIQIQCDFCDKPIERRKMEAHLCKCDEMEMLCEWCETLLKRKHYDHHINTQ